MTVTDLPLAPHDPAQSERADAARNRKRILEVAAALIEEHGIEHVSMQAVAAAAGVGPGTLYRRFGDRAGLALALLDADTRGFQDAFLHGPPPLGPGAPATARLQAFGEQYCRLLEEHAPLMLAGSVVEGQGPMSTYLTHLAVLLREAAPDVDPEFTALTLLSGLHPGRYRYAREELGWPVERLQEAWSRLVAAVCAG
jgi:AcrR family transcriptional regulator